MVSEQYVLGVDLSASQNVFFLAERKIGRIVYSEKIGQGAFYNFNVGSDDEVSRRKASGLLPNDWERPADVSRDDVRVIDLEYLGFAPQDRAGAFLRDGVLEFLDHARERGGVSFSNDDLFAVGFSVAGKVFDNGERDGTVLFLGANTPSRFGRDIGGGQIAIDATSYLREALPNTVVSGGFRGGNDCNTIGMAVARVYQSQGYDPEKTYYITVSNGIGGGGPLDLVDEIGHHTAGGVHPSVQLRCGCGKLNCVEAYASGTGLPNLARAILGVVKSPDFINFAAYERENGYPGLFHDVPNSTLMRDFSPSRPITSKAIFDAMRQGDGFAAYLVDRSSRMIAQVITDLALDYDLQIVGVGGGVGQNEPALITTVQTHVKGILDGCALVKGVMVEANPLGKAANAYGALGPVIPEEYASVWAATMLEAAGKVREGDQATLERLQLVAPPATVQQPTNPRLTTNR